MKFKVHNYHDFIDLKAFDISWTLSSMGKEIQSGHLDIGTLKAHESQLVTLPVDTASLADSLEYFVDFSVSLKQPDSLLPAGHEVAHEQFLVPLKGQGVPASLKFEALTVVRDDFITISGANFSFQFDSLGGQLVS